MIFHDIDFAILPLPPSSVPRGMRMWEERLEADGKGNMTPELQKLLRHLTGTILMFAFVSGVEHCAQLPLILDHTLAAATPFSSANL